MHSSTCDLYYMISMWIIERVVPIDAIHATAILKWQQGLGVFADQICDGTLAVPALRIWHKHLYTKVVTVLATQVAWL